MLCIPLVVVVTLLVVRLHGDAARQASRRDALHAAHTAAGRLLSYDYRHIATDLSRAKESTAGEFRREYSATTGPLQAEARRLRAIVQADVKSAAVMSASRDQVVVLLFVDQASVKQVPGANRPVTRLDQNRVQMTLSRIHGQWLVTALASL